MIATENPIEQHGTYPLPEGQLDRFALTVQVGYPDARDRDATSCAGSSRRHPLHDLEPVLTPEEVVAAQRAVREVHVDDAVLEYVVALVQATRAAPEIALGASPRATVALTRCAQARAVAEGRDYVLPDDVKALAPAALAHRLCRARSRGGAAWRATWSGACSTRSPSRCRPSEGADRAAPAQAGRRAARSARPSCSSSGRTSRRGGCSCSPRCLLGAVVAGLVLPRGWCAASRSSATRPPRCTRATRSWSSSASRTAAAGCGSGWSRPTRSSRPCAWSSPRSRRGSASRSRPTPGGAARAAGR